MIALITAALAAIPNILKALTALNSYMAKAEQAGWFIDRTKAFDDAAKAKTSEEYDNAAKEIGNVISKL